MGRVVLIIIAIAGVIGAIALSATSVLWQGDTSERQLGPSEAQQRREQNQAVHKSTPPQPLSQAQIRRYQEQLDAAGYPTGAEKGTITPQTEAAAHGSS
jgi:hypothetical protein